MVRGSFLGLAVLVALACSATESDPNAKSSSSPTSGASSGGGGQGGGAVGGGTQSGSGGTPLDLDAGPTGGAGTRCPDLPVGNPNPAVVMAPMFTADYTWHELGPVPGVPGRLGGCVLKPNDPDTLLIAGDSEAATGAIYEIGLQRDLCNHIVGFSGSATKVYTAPNVDANLLFGKNDVLIYPRWPVNLISQHLYGVDMSASTTDMFSLGVESSVSGLGFVPAYLPAAGETRTLTWPAGNWFSLDLTFDGTLYGISNPQLATTLPGGPGGFAYVPPGSPAFPESNVIVAEWSVDKVAVYETDDQGNPLVATRVEFFTAFPRPWGAYFDPVSGDYLFLTWGQAVDSVFVVWGFTKPPPPQVPE